MRSRLLLAFGNFFAVAHFYLIVYILTPYLATFMSAETASLAVALGAIITLSVFPYIPRLVVRHGPQRMGIIFAGAEGIVLLLLSTYPSPLLAIVLIALACAIPPFIVYQLDLLLEALVQDEHMTGRVRTAFITAGNLALILAPVLIALLLDGSDHYGKVFFVAALSVVPFIVIMFTKSLPQIKPPGLRSIRVAGEGFLADKDRRSIAFSYLILQFFFHIVPLYIPLYLHTVLGFAWSSLGWILAITLVPFVLLEYPAGWLADTKVGDSFILAAGFAISGLSLACLSLVHQSSSVGFILTILIAVRVGGSLVEAITEAHFFRRVSADDVEAVSFFRMMRPIGALIAPIVGSILLATASYSGLFIVCGIGILIAGLVCTYSISTPLPKRPEINPHPPRSHTGPC